MPDRGSRRSRPLPRGGRSRSLVMEPLEPRALLTATPGAEFFRPLALPQAVEPTAYFDVTTGVLQLDPVGRNLALFNFTYNTEVANIGPSTPGPFVFPAGSVLFSLAVDTAA